MAADPSAYVLDSLALLAYLEGEPGGKCVEGLLTAARSGEGTLCISLINLGEVLYIT